MQGKVSVGLATVAGYGVTIAGFAAAVAAYVTGDHSQQVLGTIIGGAVAGLAFVVTQIGRYGQAKAAIPAVTISHYGSGADAPLEAPAQDEGPHTDENTVMLDLDGDGHADPYVHTASGGFKPASSSGVQSAGSIAVTSQSPDPRLSVAGYVAEGPGDPLPQSLEPLVPADEPAPAEHADEGDARQAVVA